MHMDYSTNETAVEIIKEVAFGGTYFRDFNSGVNGKRYRNSWKEFSKLKNIRQNYFCSNYYDVNVLNVGYGKGCRIWC